MLKWLLSMGFVVCLPLVVYVGNVHAQDQVGPAGDAPEALTTEPATKAPKTERSEDLEAYKKKLYDEPVAQEVPELISHQRYVAGALTGTLIGYGIGHAVQRRWLERGWIYSVGSLAAVGVAVANFCIFSCDNRAADAAFNYAVYALFAIHLIEIVDLWTADHTPRKPTAGLGAQVSPFLGYSPQENQPTVGLSVSW